MYVVCSLLFLISRVTVTFWMRLSSPLCLPRNRIYGLLER